MKKKILSTIICIAMLVIYIPVFAATGSDVVTEARKWIGTPYGNSNGSGGYGSVVDCSGLTLQVYSKFGISLPWYADSQRSYGTKIDHSALRSSNDCSALNEGDLIFFDYRSDGVADHVAIYSGNGNVIHAISRGVTEAPLSWTTGVVSGQKFYSAVCEVRRLLTSVPGGNPPSNPRIVAYSTNIAAGEQILFEYSVENASNMYIAIDVNGVREHFIEVSGDHYNGTFTKPGHYEACLYATNAYGDSGFSNWVGFDVYDSKPTNPQLSVDKTKYDIGETVYFSCSAKYATGYTIGIDLDGKRIYTSDIGTSFEKAFDVAGTYTAYISAWNSYGLVDSSSATFTVSPKALWHSNAKASIYKNGHLYLLHDTQYDWETAKIQTEKKQDI